MNHMLSLAILLLSQQAFAQGGGTHVGGGDGECENRIHSVRRDLLRWVTENQFQGLKLQYGIERNEYVSLMQGILQDNAVDVSCTREKVTVAGAEKTCRNITETNGQRSIECNFNAINQSSQAGIYRTVHHEFASLAQVELSVGANSDYFVSDQIQEYPEAVTTLRMGVKKRFQNNIQFSLPSLTPIPFNCEKNYQTKLASLQSNQLSRKATRTVVSVSRIAGAGIIALVTPAIGIPLFLFEVGRDIHEGNQLGMSANERLLERDFFPSFNREPLLKDAVSLFAAAQFDRSQATGLKDQAALEIWKQRIDRVSSKENERRIANQLEPFPIEEFERIYPFLVDQAKPYTWIDKLSSIDGKPVSDVVYESTRQKLIALMQTNTFCPNGKLLNYNQIHKIFKK